MQALKPVCREHFRRVDRFIQLALLGSGRCVAGQELAPDLALYLGSGLGPMSNNITTQQQLIRDRLLPKPFNFINTLGNSAGYYVAKNLGLNGQNLFISRRGASFQATLVAALVDYAGRCRTAGTGGCRGRGSRAPRRFTAQATARRRRTTGGRQSLAVAEVEADKGQRLEHSYFTERGALDAAVADARDAALLQESSGLFHDSIMGGQVTERLMKGTGLSDAGR